MKLAHDEDPEKKKIIDSLLPGINDQIEQTTIENICRTNVIVEQIKKLDEEEILVDKQLQGLKSQNELIEGKLPEIDEQIDAMEQVLRGLDDVELDAESIIS